MVVVGADVHKHTHTFVAVDQVGRQLGKVTVAARSDGHARALAWARERFGQELVWAIEDCRHLSARLERDLLTAGQQVVRVPPKMMAEQRRIARTRGKSDPIDALAVARAAAREPGLPVATHDQDSREAKVLVDRREALLGTRTRKINSLLWRVHELDPAMAPKPRSPNRLKHQQVLATRLAELPGMVAEIARDELADVMALTKRINVLEARIRKLARDRVPALMELLGCAALNAAKLLGESAGITRFASEAQFARHGGLAPIPVWSGRTKGRVRMTRSGNRQINAAIHRIALTQIRHRDSQGAVYYQRKIAEGKTKTEALRCLKRRLARWFNRLTTDHHNRQPAPETAPETAAA